MQDMKLSKTSSVNTSNDKDFIVVHPYPVYYLRFRIGGFTLLPTVSTFFDSANSGQSFYTQSILFYIFP